MSSSISTSETEIVTRNHLAGEPNNSASRDITDDYYGKLIDLNSAKVSKGKLRGFTWTLLIGLFVCLVFVEALHRYSPYYNKELDIQMKELAGLKNQTFEVLVLGDSVTRQSFWGTSLGDDALMLATAAGVSILGNELIARRFFEQGNTVDHVVLTFSPIGYLMNQGGDYADTLFYPVFNRPAERKIILERTGVDGAKELSNGVINKRVKALMAFLQSELSLSRRERRSIPTSLVEKATNYETDPRSLKLYERAQRLDADEVFKSNEILRQHLINLVNYLQSQNVSITLVIPPMVEGTDLAFLNSEFGELIKDLAKRDRIRWVNMNLLRTYSPSAFLDGVHLHRVWEQRFVNDLVVMIPSLQPRQIEEVDPFVLPVERSFRDTNFRGGRLVRKFGETGIVSGSLSFSAYTEIDREACLAVKTIAKSHFKNSVRLRLNHKANIDWHFPVQDKRRNWHWVERREPLRLSAGWNLISIMEREGSAISAVRLDACP